MPKPYRGDFVLQRFTIIVDAIEQPFRLTDLCLLLGVSDRALRDYCRHAFGMSPKRYLLHRRMLHARHALQGADPARETVTTIAVGNGFRHLGRFAGEYRTLFGEAPSATLHRVPDRVLLSEC
jgi:AraC family ethanolamine operon transcriptional activator